MNTFEGVSKLSVSVLIEGVEVGTNGTGKENRVLGDDCKSASKVVKVDLGDIDTVDMNTTFTGFKKSEERQG